MAAEIPLNQDQISLMLRVFGESVDLNPQIVASLSSDQISEYFYYVQYTDQRTHQELVKHLPPDTHGSLSRAYDYFAGAVERLAYSNLCYIQVPRRIQNNFIKKLAESA